MNQQPSQAAENLRNRGVMTDESCRGSEQRRDFLKYITALTGWTVVSGAHLMRGTPTIAGDPSNDDKAWGGVKGRVVLEGKVPESKEIDLAKYNIQGDDLKWFQSMGPILNEDWVVDPKHRGVQWVFVYLIPEKDKRGNLNSHPALDDVPKDRQMVPIDQAPTGYVPHAVAIRAGQGIVMRNTGPIAHAFNMVGFANSPQNRAMPPGAEIAVPKMKAEAGAVNINCPPHPWERMTLRVFDHPYFAVTNQRGEFDFRLAPSGKCRLVVWHESIGYRGGRSGRYGEVIEVEGGAISDLGDITVKI